MPTGIPVSVEDQEIMVKAYMTGATLVEASALIGRTHRSCSLALSKRNLSRREQTDAQRTYALNDRFFRNINTEEKSYWLGFIAADGCVMNNALAINLSIVDREHLCKFMRSLDSEVPVFDYIANGRRMCRASISSTRIVDDLRRVGIHPRKTFSVKPWVGSPSLMKHYWRGAFDGDGALFKTKRNSNYKNKSYEADHWSVEFAGNLEMAAGFALFIEGAIGCHKEPTPMSSIFRVRYGGIDLPQQVTAALYQDSAVFLDRKKILADELAAITPNQRWLGGITPDELRRLFDIHGSREAVAAHLKCSVSALLLLRRRLGVFRDGRETRFKKFKSYLSDNSKTPALSS
jgi:hypothetical protein